MADSVPLVETDEDSLLARHKRERKELQSKIQSLKKGCVKGDKKRKKEVTEEIAKLEADLDQKQEAELQELKQTSSLSGVEASLETLAVSSDPLPDQQQAAPRVTKAQKRRDKKSEKEKERAINIAKQAEENKFGPRHLEEVKLKEILASKNLTLHEVPSDGNCLYSAIAHQLKFSEEPQLANVSALRTATAAYLRTHIEDLRPFTSSPSTGLELSEEEYEKYCDSTQNDSSAWGGQLELQALAEALKRSIEVLQAEGPAVVLGEQYKSKPAIVLAYHRHAFGLGEHYNSVSPRNC